jgi:hypothetical protein
MGAEVTTKENTMTYEEYQAAKREAEQFQARAQKILDASPDEATIEMVVREAFRRAMPPGMLIDDVKLDEDDGDAVLTLKIRKRKDS